MPDMQYLIGEDLDNEFKDNQEKIVKKVKWSNKLVRSKIAEIKKMKKEDGLLQAEVIRYGISRSKLEKLVEAWKIRKYKIWLKDYYNRFDVVNYL